MRSRQPKTPPTLEGIARTLDRMAGDVRVLCQNTAAIRAIFEEAYPRTMTDAGPRTWDLPASTPAVATLAQSLANRTEVALNDLRVIHAVVNQIRNGDWSYDDLRDFMRDPARKD